MDYSFRDFRALCRSIGGTASHLEKTKILSDFFASHSTLSQESKFLVISFLLCNKKYDSHVYHMSTKNMIKIFARIFDVEVDDMTNFFNQSGELSETIMHYHLQWKKFAKQSTFSMHTVQTLLDELATKTRHDDQYAFFKNIVKNVTPDDLKYIIKMIDHDLGIHMGAKFVCQALHPHAWNQFKSNANIQHLFDCWIEKKFASDGNDSESDDSNDSNHNNTIKTGTMINMPVKPMLAKAVQSLEAALVKIPKDMIAEVKYDGERVQLHYQNTNQNIEYKFFSRNLKPVVPSKVEGVKPFVEKAFSASTINAILDCEVLLMDSKGEPLPFGTLGVHKKANFTDATVCLVVFDILFLDNVSLMNKPLYQRKQILEQVIHPIPNHIVFSDAMTIKSASDLDDRMNFILGKKMEGLIFKDPNGIYKPDHRSWLKIKKDYLEGMADSADLVVLGAYYGTGHYGGMMSVFLMGVWDEPSQTFKTVCKVGNGFSDAQLKQVHDSFEPYMEKVKGKVVPDWLDVSSTYIPDLVWSSHPKTVQNCHLVHLVWEVAGSEFSVSASHTAVQKDGKENLSIRFPRIIKMRSDKTLAQATSHSELQDLAVESSKGTSLANKKQKK